MNYRILLIYSLFFVSTAQAQAPIALGKFEDVWQGVKNGQLSASIYPTWFGEAKEKDKFRPVAAYLAAQYYIDLLQKCHFPSQEAKMQRYADSVTFFLTEAQYGLQQERGKRLAPYFDGQAPDEALYALTQQTEKFRATFFTVQQQFHKIDSLYQVTVQLFDRFVGQYPETIDRLMMSTSGFGLATDSLRRSDAVLGFYIKQYAQTSINAPFILTPIAQARIADETALPVPEWAQSNNIALPAWSEWLEQLEDLRTDRIARFAFWASELASALDQEHETNSDSVQVLHADIVGFAQLAKQIDPASFLPTYFQYKKQSNDLKKHFTQEEKSLNYDRSKEEAIQYYYTLYQSVLRTKTTLQELQQMATPRQFQRYKQFLDQHCGGKAGFLEAIRQAGVALSEQERYCQIRIKDRLVAEYLAPKYAPKFTEFEGKILPLFQQPFGIAVENGHMVTLDILRLSEDSLYLTGYQKLATKKAFAAFVVNKKVVWFTLLPVEAQQDAATAGQRLAKIQNGLAVWVSASPENPSIHYLVELNPVGQSTGVWPIQEKGVPQAFCKQEQSGHYLVATSLPHPQNRTWEQTALRLYAPTGQLVWENLLPISSRLSEIRSHNEGFILITNHLRSHDSNGMPIKTPKEQAPSLLVGQLNLDGAWVARRTFFPETPHVITFTTELSSGNYLLIGFEGAWQVGELPDHELVFYQFAPDWQLVHTSLAADGLAVAKK